MRRTPSPAFDTARSSRASRAWTVCDQAAAVVDAPEPEIAEDFPVARGGADDHAGELSVELAGHDHRGGIVLGRTDEQAAVFGVGVGRDLEVEPGRKEREATGEQQGGARDAAKAQAAGLHGGEFLLRAHPSEGEQHAGQQPEGQAHKAARRE
jgi:hypothetical protein